MSGFKAYGVTDHTKRVQGFRPTGWLVAGLFVVLAGCALTFAYRHADWLILWQLDHYFDLTTDQRRDLSSRLKPLLARHRREAMPLYEAFLEQIRQRIERGLTSQDIDWIYATYDRLRADLFDRVVTDGGVFLASVDPRQVRTLEEALQKDYERAARLVHAPAPKRLNKRAEVIIDGLEDWLGSLSGSQRAEIRTWSLALPDTQRVWLAYQQQRRQELLALLQQPRTPEGATRELRAILVYPDHSAPEAYREAVRRMRAAVKTLALAVDQRLTDRQRRHALAKLQRLIEQLHDLHVE